MQTQLLKEARKKMRNKYGTALSKKVTDELCMQTFQESLSPHVASFSEEVSVAQPGRVRPAAIIEFAESPVQKGWAKTGAGTGKKLNKILETFSKEEDITINIRQFLRESKIKAYRESVIRSIQHVNAFLERKIERGFTHGNRSLQDQAYLTRLCWLNQTVQTIARTQTLAEIADDPKIIKFDVPRKLEGEINETGKLVFAPQYRQKFSRTGKGVIIAVIDSEVALNLKALKDRVVQRKNFTKEPWGNPSKHGTGVAGIIGSDDTDFSGMAPQATIYNYKVLATDSTLNADTFDGTSAIERALEDGAHIANCSWGAGPATDGSGREARACNNAWDMGMTVVKSAGNNGPGAGTLTTPADARGIIVVGATGKDGKKIEDYSSRGPLTSGEHRPHVVAPGGSFGNGIFSCLTAGGFDDIGRGTSFAAPHVSGLLALLLEEDHTLSPDEQRNLALKLCKKLSGFGLDAQGTGIISFASLINP